MADVGAHEKRGARRVSRLECLYNVVASVRGAFDALPACDCATQLDLQREPASVSISAELPDFLATVS
jgi:hypothetical protein